MKMQPDIPNYALYGEEGTALFPDTMHCESIASRSRQLDWRIAPHRHHRLHQFFLLESGGGSIALDGQFHELIPPVAITIPHLTVHGFRFHKETQGWVITIPQQVLDEALKSTPDLIAEFSTPAVVSATPEIAASIKQIETEHRNSRKSRHGYLTHLVGILAIDFARRLEQHRFDIQKKSPEKTHLQTFLALLEERYMECHSAGGDAAAIGLTTQHLNRLCQQVTGRTTSKIIQERLMLEAKRSLVYTRMSVSEVAYSLGFTDPAHFSRLFRQNIGLSPKAFRNSIELVP
tara:strand:- start:9247 stop:10116 length:870 start_codon:yes stop_codon:yes gene_type:complete